MIPYCTRIGIVCVNLSRVCGDDPERKKLTFVLLQFVPRMRGWSLLSNRKYKESLICPAYAGMILPDYKDRKKYYNLSRVCGDDPYLFHILHNHLEFVPRMRGWSLLSHDLFYILFICPAYAGMIPGSLFLLSLSRYLSRVCGDDPITGGTSTNKNSFVPRMRGWSFEWFFLRVLLVICPAYAGMILLA